MKKIQLLLLAGLLVSATMHGQNRKLYVSKQGGEKRVWLLGKVGYNNYMYHGGSGDCDSLVCSSVGFEPCTISRSMFRDKKDAVYVSTYNKIIRQAAKVIRISRSTEGQFTYTVDHYKAVVKYKNADYKKHNADMEIELL